ncbi:MAG: hypothetical protein A2W31_18575 [Planctomycetes bacterium RBG_16_64_10]|nr:MAG: hypothetical protein A2W31_18575 [Planctomycetes bacterium RBG_16_64_10]
MALGLTPTRSDRRRRVLTEELLSVGATSAGATAGPANQLGAAAGPRADNRYPPAATYKHRARVTDIIPRWWITVVLLWLTGVGLTAGLVALYVRQPDLAALLGQAQVPVLDLAGLRGAVSGSLAGWFASALLGLATVISALVYSVRRHRIDDYHGRYRVWLWAALVWLALSLNTTTQLHRLAVDTLIYWTGWSALRDGAVWWLAPVIVLAVTIGLRLLADTRECGIACAVLTTAYSCWTVAILVHLGMLDVGDELLTTVVIAGAVLGGHVSLVTAQVVYARHVVLEADGPLPQRCQSTKEASAPKSRPPGRSAADRGGGPEPASAAPERESAAGRPVPERPAPASWAPPTNVERGGTATAGKATPRVTEWTDGCGPSDPRDDGDVRPEHSRRKLSKADRKRLRKLKQDARQRHAA